ncbi:MAG: hypothetical protein QHH75_11640 [Bacillota bacterium]|nr:hypothetical protein [Bacillota bacterium]
MFIKGDLPEQFDGISLIGKNDSVICPICGVIWSVSRIHFLFSEEEKERFWAGKGCPDCKIVWRG